MDSRSVAFLEIMAAIGIIGLVAFLIFLVSRQSVQAQANSSSGGASQQQPRWVELLLAAAAVLILCVLFLWQYPPWSAATDSGAANEGGGWDRGFTFFTIMLIIGGGGLVVFLVALFWQIARSPARSNSAIDPPPAVNPSTASGPSAAVAPQPAARASHETPSTVRLLGLLGFGVAFLVLNWSAVPVAKQYALMLHLIYPAGFIVAVVMMFDKASRAWHVKVPGETLREWLFFDAILLLYVIGYLNLLAVGEAGTTGADAAAATATDAATAAAAAVGTIAYNAMFWDFLHVLGFLLTLWVIDRKTTRLRFFFAHIYLLALPILLLIWRKSQGLVTSTEISWWETIWPFFFLALIFLVAEIIVLMANRESGSQGGGTAKDIVFFILYVIILIAARPAAVGG